MTISPNNVVVSRSSHESDEPYEVIQSNISFVNALFDELLEDDEISPDALRSYYVDYYLAQIDNGGFSQFVYNSRWNARLVALVADGLRAVGAREHLALLQRAQQRLEELGPAKLQAYLESEYFDENPTRDQLDEETTAAFHEISLTEDLIALNSRWLRSLPNLSVLNEQEWAAEVARRSAALPDRELRRARARANEPRYVKIIRALCAMTGQELSHLTAGDPNHRYAGSPTLAWHFVTDKGHHYMVESGGKALMFGDGSSAAVAVMTSPPET